MTAVLDLPATRSRDGLLVVTDGVVAVANQALCRLLGTHPDELLGCPPPDWVPSPPESGEDLDVALAAGENWSPRAQARLHQAALAHDLGRLAHLSPALDAEQIAWIAGEGDGAELLRIAAADPATLAADAAERRRGALAWWG